ncbi:MAG: TRAP transporter small permease [Bacteroidota bacterium]
MNFILSIDTGITRVVNFMLVVLFIFMLGLAVIQVILRYFFNSGILWGDIVARNLVLWVGMLGAILATRENKHFHIDVLTRFLKNRHQVWFKSFSDLFSAVICYFLGQASITFLALDTETRTFFNLPIIVIEIIIPIGFYLMMLQFIVHMVLNFSAKVPPDSASIQTGP